MSCQDKIAGNEIKRRSPRDVNHGKTIGIAKDWDECRCPDTQSGDKDHHDQNSWDRAERIDNAHHVGIDPPADQGQQQPDQRAPDHGDKCGQCGDQHRRAPAKHDPRQDVPPQSVGTERMRQAGHLQHQVRTLCNRIVWQNKRRQHSQHHMAHNQRDANCTRWLRQDGAENGCADHSRLVRSRGFSAIAIRSAINVMLK